MPDVDRDHLRAHAEKGVNRAARARGVALKCFTSEMPFRLS